VVAPSEEHRLVLVTGGSRGIGRSIVEAFADSGADVAFSYHIDRVSADEVTSRAAAGGVRAFAFQAELSEIGAADRLVRDATSVLGGLNVVVNSAGIYPHAAIDDTTPEFVDRMFRINVEAPFAIIRRAADELARTGGAIVNVTSIDSFDATVGLAAYAASKAALTMLTRSAALELGPRGIRVNAVAPGLVWAPGIENVVPEMVAAQQAHSPLGRLVAPQEVASAVLFLASSLAAGITGHTLVVDAGVTLAGYAHAAAHPMGEV